MRTRSERRFNREVKKMRRLKEDWNQHSIDGYHHGPRYADGTGPVNTKDGCPCYWDPKTQAMFADTPKRCTCCCNPRHDPMVRGADRLTVQERRVKIDYDEVVQWRDLVSNS